jgi:hypothetical protein
MHTDSTPAREAVRDDTGRLEQMLGGFGISHSIYAAAKLGIADLLDDGPRTAEELPGSPAFTRPPCTGCCEHSPASACSRRPRPRRSHSHLRPSA